MNKMRFRTITVDAVLRVREKSIIVVHDDDEVVIPRSNLSWKTDNEVVETENEAEISVAEWWLNSRGM